MIVFGKVSINSRQEIINFVEKGCSSGPGFINAGIYLIGKKIIKSITAEKAFSLEEEFFPELVGKGLYGYPCEGSFIDIGTPESYSQAEAFFSRTYGWECSNDVFNHQPSLESLPYYSLMWDNVNTSS